MKNEKNLRERLWNETSGHCAYCGHPVSLEEMEVDHITPKSIGGSNCFNNLVCTCHHCNAEKGADLLEEYLLDWSEKRLRRYHNRIETWLEQGKISLEKAEALTPLDRMAEKEEPFPLDWELAGDSQPDLQDLLDCGFRAAARSGGTLSVTLCFSGC